MAYQNQSVFGLYPDQASIDDAIDALRENGFQAGDISTLMPDNSGTKDFAHEKHSKAPEFAAASGAAGALAGGAIGWLAGMGTLGLPGIEPIAAAGPTLGLLSGVGIASTVAALAGGLVGASVPEYEAKRYEGRVRRGGILLSVHCHDAGWVRRAHKVMKQTGAEHISAAKEETVRSFERRDEHDIAPAETTHLRR